MFFKNLILYRINKPLAASAEKLAGLLAEQSFRPTGKTEMVSAGWVPPMDGGQLVFTQGRHDLIALRKEEKLLPGSVVRDHVNEKIASIETEQGRQVFKKEKDEIRDEVRRNLLPRAFSRSTITRAWIDHAGGWFVVDAGSYRKAEELTSMLRSCLGSLAILPVSTNSAPAAIMTQWLQEPKMLPPTFAFGHSCKLKEAGSDGAVISARNEDLCGNVVSVNIEEGRQASAMTVEWRESVFCEITDSLQVRKVYFTPYLLEKNDHQCLYIKGDHDSYKAVFDAEFALMTGTLSQFLSELVDAFGGEPHRDAA